MVTKAKPSGLKYEIVEILENGKDCVLESGDLTEMFLLALQASETIELKSSSGKLSLYSKEDVVMSVAQGKLIIEVSDRSV
jgi:hypothetical protein